jgi:hypothetical protein
MCKKRVLILAIITIGIMSGCAASRSESNKEGERYCPEPWDAIDAIGFLTLRKNEILYPAPGGVFQTDEKSKWLFADLHGAWGQDMLFQVESEKVMRFSQKSFPKEILSAVEIDQDNLGAALPFVPTLAVCWYSGGGPADPALLSAERLSSPRVIFLCDGNTGSFICRSRHGVWSDRRVISNKQRELLNQIAGKKIIEPQATDAGVGSRR